MGVSARAVLFRLVIGVLLLDMCVIGIVGGTLWQSRSQYHQRAKAEVETQSMVLERDVASLIDRIDVILQSVTDEVLRQSRANRTDLQELSSYLVRQGDRVPEIMGLRLVDANGTVFLSPQNQNGRGDGVNLSDRPRFRIMRENPNSGLQIDGPLMGRISSRHVLIFARRLSGADGRFLGEVHATLNMEHLGVYFSTLALGNLGAVSMWSGENGFVARYTRYRGLEIGGNLLPSDELKALLTQGIDAAAYSAVARADGVAREFYVRRIKGRPLFVVLGIAESEFLDSWWSQVELAIWLTGLFCVFTALSGVVIFRGWRQRQGLEISRNQAQAHLSATVTRLSQVLETAAEGIIGLDEHGQVIFANQAAAISLGWLNSETMLGLASHQVFGHQLDDGRPCTCGICAIRETLSDGVIRRVEDEYFLGRNSDPLPVSYAVSPLRAEDGQSGAVVIFHDVSDRKMAEAEIRSLLAYQGAVWDNTPVGIAIFDLNRILRQANRCFLSLFAPPGDDIIGRTADFLYVDPMISQHVREKAYPIILQGKIFSDDVAMRGGDGRDLWIRLTGRMVNETEPQMGVVWAFEDMTQRRTLELEIQRSNADLEQFAYVTSHDLRQPLRMITSYLGLIERRMGHLMDQDAKEFFAFASDGAKRLDRLILDLLDYSRVGRGADVNQRVSLSDVMAQAVQNLSVAIADAQADLIVAADLPVVRGDPSSLVRLFQNLIGNAVKYRQPGRPCQVQVGCSPNGHEWQIWVRDNGIGIEPDQHDRIFGVFQRLVSESQYEGTGIGLAICKKIVKQHGGQIWVQSQPDQGCTFFLTLPTGE